MGGNLHYTVFRWEVEENCSDEIPVSVYPNPFSGRFTINFSLDHAVKAEIGIFDINGKSLRNLFYEKFPPGINSIMLDGNSLLPGVYVLCIKAGKKESFIKILNFRN